MSRALQEIFEKHQDTPLKRFHKKAVLLSVLHAVLLAGFAFAGEYLIGDVTREFPVFIVYLVIGVLAAGTVFIFKKRSALLEGEVEEEEGKQLDKKSEEAETAFCRRLSSAHTVSYVFGLCVGAIGLILYFLAGDRTILYGMISAGFFFMVIFYPRREDWVSRLKEYREEDIDLAAVLKKQSIGRG